MDLRREIKYLILFSAFFLFLYLFPFPERILKGVREGVLLLSWYAREHVLFWHYTLDKCAKGGPFCYLEHPPYTLDKCAMACALFKKDCIKGGALFKKGLHKDWTPCLKRDCINFLPLTKVKDTIYNSKYALTFSSS